MSTEEAPLCACECGDRVGKNDKGKWNKYIKLHAQQHFKPTHLDKANEVRRRGAVPIEKFRSEVLDLKAKNRWTNADILRFAELSHGNFSNMMYSKTRTHITRSRYTEIMAALRRMDGFTVDRSPIPIDKFREHLFAIKAKRDLKIKDIAEICGQRPGYFQSILYDQSKKTITKDVARHILMRLAGKPTPPTDYEKQKMQTRKVWERELQGIG